MTRQRQIERAAMRLSVLCLVVSTAVCGQPAAPDSPTRTSPANEAEMQIIRDAFDIDRWSPEMMERVLSFEGWRWSSDEPPELAGFVSHRPALVQGSMCVAWEFALHGVPDGDGYEWQPQSTYRHWLGASRDDCDVESYRDIPASVLTRVAIPSDAMIRILQAEDELIRLTLANLRQVDVDVIEDLSADWRLSDIALSVSLDPELGFAYRATFRAPGRSRGPTCIFTFRDGEIVVHATSVWVA